MVSRTAPPARSAFRHFETIGTRWSDNDAYGHVNNTVHYQWFDSIVNRWLIGQGLLDIGSGDPIALVVETGCRFHSPLRFPGEVELGLRVVEIGRRSVRYAIGVFAADCEPASADGYFVHVAVARADRRPVPWPDRWRTAFAAIS